MSASDRALLQALYRYAVPSAARSIAQVVSTLVAIAALLAAERWLAPSPLRFLLVLPLAACLVRIFTLQHDCGHRSLFRSKRANDVAGTLLSAITGVGYEPWRNEHLWHHKNQAKLTRRGIDRVNSPMTTDEARAEPRAARQRHRLIHVVTVFVLGIHSLLVKRKRLAGFFFRRPGFQGRCGDPRAVAIGLWTTNVLHASMHAAFIAGIGLGPWATFFMPAVFIGGGCGAVLFWVQHNFEHTHHAGDEAWTFVDAGLRGSSFIALPGPLAWATCDIGLHHVHHLNARVPNYRLEEARRAIPAIAAVRPLTFSDLRRCFTHVFWDPARGRMISFDELTAEPR